MLILQLLLLVTSVRIARDGANYSTTPRGDPNLDLQQLLLVQLSPFGEVTFLFSIKLINQLTNQPITSQPNFYP